MASLAGVEPERRLSWPVLLLILAAVTSSSLSALSLYQLVVLRTEVEVLKAEVCRRRQEGHEGEHKGQMDYFCAKRNSPETLQRPETEKTPTLTRKKRLTTGNEILDAQYNFSGGEQPLAYVKNILYLHGNKQVTLPGQVTVSQSCLQFMPNGNRKIFKKEFDFDEHTGIPWQTGLRRGSALEEDQDRILIQQEGYYYVYSQVYYRDTQVAMGHVIIRWKASVVGNEAPHVVLFRCIKNMRQEYSFNTCYTGGIVKLEFGDHLELLIPRRTANISLDGEGTFMGAVKLV